jgi:predicted nucleotidyltransferase
VGYNAAAMNAILQSRLADLRLLCLRYGVERLDLFGSAARDDFDPETSDFDFLVEFKPMKPAEHADAFFGLLESLERLFGRRVDLLEPEPIANPYLKRSIEETRTVLYENAA